MKINEIISSVDKETIEEIFEKHFTAISDIDIDNNGYISSSDTISLRSTISQLPVKFLKVDETFLCVGKKLVSLDGCPKEVGKDFYCYINKLSSLKGGPITVNRLYNCSKNPLKSLEGLPKQIGGQFTLSYSNDLPLLRLLTLTNFNFDNHSNIKYAFDIMVILLKYAGQGRKAALDCAADLLSLGKKLDIDLTRNARW